MKKRVRLVIAALVFVLGAALIAYPYVSDYVHKQQQHEVISVQDEAVESADEADLADELARAQDYNERLLSSKTVVTDPFDPDAQRVTSEEYESLLNLNDDGVMGTLVIPKIDLEVPIYHYTNDEELQEGVGHMESTSLPVGGPSTHAVLAGHNGLPMVKIFDRAGRARGGGLLRHPGAGRGARLSRDRQGDGAAGGDGKPGGAGRQGPGDARDLHAVRREHAPAARARRALRASGVVGRDRPRAGGGGGRLA